MGKYIGIYFAFGIGSASLVVVQTLILWIFCSIEVSTIGVVHHANATTVRKLIWCPVAGVQKAAREDGLCYFPVTDELLRNVSRSDPESDPTPNIADDIIALPLGVS